MPWHTVLIRATLILPLLSAAAAQAEDRLGMKVFGDDDTAFGLLISNWRQDDKAALFAPGLAQEELEPTDPWLLEMQAQARRALTAPTGESTRPETPPRLR